jgi:phenol 2-monooxygenase
MQFHLNGFKPGDPSLSEAPERLDARQSSEVDVLIVGCGPAGLTLAAQLSAFPDIRTRIIEQKPGPLSLGQADGIACRTMEMFEAFGFSERVLKESYWVNETVFAAAEFRTPKTGCPSSRMSSSIRRGCMTSSWTSCARRRRGSSRTMPAACKT